MRLPPSLALVVIALSAGASANDLLHEAQYSEGSGTVGPMRSLPNLDGDGVRDLAFGSVYGVRWSSGRTGAHLRFVDFGFAPRQMLDAGDLDGDGFGDVVIVTWESAMVVVRALSSATTLPVWTFSGTDYGFGCALASIPDRDGDLVPEVLVGVHETRVTGSSDNPTIQHFGQGRIEVRSGATGQPLATAVPPSGADRCFGGWIASAGDFDGDGRGDFVTSPYCTDYFPAARGDARVYSSATLTEIRAIAGSGFGSRRATAVGDTDGDGLDEIVVVQPYGSAQVHAGATGASLATLPTQASLDVGESIAALGDVDGDGAADFALGCSQPPVPWIGGQLLHNGPGYVQIWSGATLSLHSTIVGTDLSKRLGTAVVSPGDVDGDGVPDVAIAIADLPRVRTWSGRRENTTPQRYCVGSLMSSGTRAWLDHSGTTSASANDLVLRARNTGAGSTGLFVYSRNAAAIRFSAGWRCVGAPFFRIGPVVAIASDGTASKPVDLHAPPFVAGPGSAGTGDTVYFQFLFRSGTTSSATDGLAVTFHP